MPDLFEEWKDILDYAAHKAEPKSVGLLVCWSGVIYSFDHPYIRLDNTFLNLVYEEDGVPIFRRTPGRKLTVNNEVMVVFSRMPLYRITDGERKGHTVTLPEVRSREHCRLAGLEKKLVIGTDTDCFHPRRKGDRQVIDLLWNLKGLQHVAVKDAVPEVLLTCGPEQTMLKVRDTEEARNLICTHPGFDPGLSLDRNLIKMRHHFHISLGGNRVGYHFDTIYGRGVLAVDIRKFGLWYRISPQEEQKGYVRIQ